MGEDLHKEGIGKYYQERLEKIYCSIRKNILSENCLSILKFTPRM